MTTAADHDVLMGLTLSSGQLTKATDLIEAQRDSGISRLTIMSNNMGVDGIGLVIWTIGRFMAQCASGMGRSMDLVAGAKRIVVLCDHVAKDGASRL